MIKKIIEINDNVIKKESLCKIAALMSLMLPQGEEKKGGVIKLILN